MRGGFADAFEDRQQARLFLISGNLCGAGMASLRTGTGAFSAEVEDIGTVVDALHAVGDCGFGIEEGTAVAERVGCDVDDAHDEGAAAELHGAGTELPRRENAGHRDHLEVGMVLLISL